MEQKFQNLQDDICSWANKTFGKDRLICGELYHLVDKADELIRKSDDINQYADCFILILNAMSQKDLSVNDLLIASQEKMEINKKRSWGRPDWRSVVHHIK